MQNIFNLFIVWDMLSYLVWKFANHNPTQPKFYERKNETQSNPSTYEIPTESVDWIEVSYICRIAGRINA